MPGMAFGCFGRGGAGVYQLFDEQLFNINIETEHADKGKGAEKILILFRRILKSCLSLIVLSYHILF